MVWMNVYCNMSNSVQNGGMIPIMYGTPSLCTDRLDAAINFEDRLKVIRGQYQYAQVTYIVWMCILDSDCDTNFFLFHFCCSVS